MNIFSMTLHQENPRLFQIISLFQKQNAWLKQNKTKITKTFCFMEFLKHD